MGGDARVARWRVTCVKGAARMALRAVFSVMAIAPLMLTGCSCLSTTTVVEVPPTGQYDDYCASGHDLRMLNAPCRKPYGFGQNHCGLQGVACTLSSEACALVHCMASSHWEGDYPLGA